MKYRIDLSYDGSNFYGFAKQPNNLLTVQDFIEQKLSIIFDEKIIIFAAGRTDKYVHAVNQTVHFSSKKIIEPNQIKHFLNSQSDSIFVKNIEIVDNSFNARYSAKSKIYCYVINIGEHNVFQKNYELQYNKELNLEKIKEILNLFIGKKDFKSFSTSDLKDTVRKIFYIKIFKKNKKVYFFISGNGFLRNMVRMIIGTFLEYEKENITKQQIINLFNNPKKGSSIYKAKGCGLYLFKVVY